MEWIKLEDKSPKDGEMVIIWDGEDSTHAKYKDGKFFQDTSWCGVDYGIMDSEISLDWITHWMPLPEGPKK